MKIFNAVEPSFAVSAPDGRIYVFKNRMSFFAAGTISWYQGMEKLYDTVISLDGYSNVVETRSLPVLGFDIISPVDHDFISRYEQDAVGKMTGEYNMVTCKNGRKLDLLVSAMSPNLSILNHGMFLTYWQNFDADGNVFCIPPRAYTVRPYIFDTKVKSRKFFCARLDWEFLRAGNWQERYFPVLSDIRLLSTQTSTGIADFQTGGGGGFSQGAFNVEYDAATSKIRVYDTSDETKSGIVWIGTSSYTLDAVSLDLPTNSNDWTVCLCVDYDSSRVRDKYTFSIQYGTSGHSDLAFYERLAVVSNYTEVNMSRSPGDIRVTGRWV